MKNSWKLLSLLLLVVGGLCVAVTAQALTLIPPSYESAVDPGVPLNTTIKLYNETQSPLELFPKAVNFTAEGESGQPSYDVSAPTTGAASWFALPEGSLKLDPGERLVVPITITPPADAEPGGHYVNVIFSTQPPDSTSGGDVAIGFGIGSLYLLRVFGDVTEAGMITEFNVDAEQSSSNRLPVTLYTRFSNTGNIHLRPTGQVTIKNTFGRESVVLPLNQSEGATLPDSTRRYEVVWEKNIVTEATGNIWSTFWSEFGSEWNNFAFGRYTATVDVVAGGGGLITDSATITFWLWPWRVLVLSVIILALLVLLFIFTIKRYNHWIINKVRNSQTS